MKIFSEKVNYGLLALIELAKNYYKGHIQIKDIANSQNIPKSYLEQLLVLLKNSELVESKRGAQGGYKLKIAPKNIKVIDLIKAFERPINFVDYSKISETLQVYWKEIETKFIKLFDDTLEDLINRELHLNQNNFYQI
jgi:Rrf2 family protein